MNLSRRLLLASGAACATLALAAAPSMAVVGGNDASPGEYPSVAEVTLGPGFLCTGTLIAPTWVLTAGHCGSVTGAAVATPISWPAPLIDVRIGSVKPGEGEQVPVSRAIVSPDYLVTDGFDITLLDLSQPSSMRPTPVAGAGQRSSWVAGANARIVGFGATDEGGDSASTLQEATVPIVSDASCAESYDNFDSSTMVCAGYPQGGVDTCQGDSGGPLFGSTGAGLRVVGSTSFGEGCAREGFPGVYARVADQALRDWIASQAPEGVDSGGAGAAAASSDEGAGDGSVIGAGAYDSSPPPKAKKSKKAKKRKAAKKSKKAKKRKKGKRKRRARR